MKRLHWILLLMILLIPTESISAKKKTEKSDREIWCDVMYRMEAPERRSAETEYARRIKSDMGRAQSERHLYGMLRSSNGGTGTVAVIARR